MVENGQILIEINYEKGVEMAKIDQNHGLKMNYIKGPNYEPCKKLIFIQ